MSADRPVLPCPHYDGCNVEYLALPYTHEDGYIENCRAEISDCIAAYLTSQGRVVFAPISAWHHIAKKYKLPGNFEYWAILDEEFIKRCDKLLVIKLNGWKESKGLKLELKLANKYGKPIEYIDPTPFIKELNFGGFLYGEEC